MKRKTLIVTFATTVVFLVGCDQADVTSKQLDQVREKTLPAAQDLSGKRPSQWAAINQRTPLERFHKSYSVAGI